MVVPFAKTGEVQNAEKERQKEKIAYVLCGILAVVLFPVVRAQRQMVQMKSFRIRRHDIQRRKRRVRCQPAQRLFRLGVYPLWDR